MTWSYMQTLCCFTCLAFKLYCMNLIICFDLHWCRPQERHEHTSQLWHKGVQQNIYHEPAVATATFFGGRNKFVNLQQLSTVSRERLTRGVYYFQTKLLAYPCPTLRPSQLSADTSRRPLMHGIQSQSFLGGTQRRHQGISHSEPLIGHTHETHMSNKNRIKYDVVDLREARE